MIFIFIHLTSYLPSQCQLLSFLPSILNLSLNLVFMECIYSSLSMCFFMAVMVSKTYLSRYIAFCFFLTGILFLYPYNSLTVAILLSSSLISFSISFQPSLFFLNPLPSPSISLYYPIKFHSVSASFSISSSNISQFIFKRH